MFGRGGQMNTPCCVEKSQRERDRQGAGFHGQGHRSAGDHAGDAMNIMRAPLLAVLLLLNPAAYAQVIQFDSVADPLKLPRDLHFGEVTGVAVNSRGHVFVLSRGNTTGPAYAAAATRSEERRVGKECRSRWSPYL